MCILNVILLLAAFAVPVYTVDIPDWVIPGILAVESKSYYKEDGTIEYVVRTRGKAGERGCCQVTLAAFKQVCKRGEMFASLDNPEFCVEIAERYLVWLYTHAARKNWDRAIEMYNAGPGKSSKKYLAKVRSYK